MRYLFPMLSTFSGQVEAREFVENHKYFFLFQLLYYVVVCCLMVAHQLTLNVGSGGGFFGFVLAMLVVTALMKSFVCAFLMARICGNYSVGACAAFVCLQVYYLVTYLLEPSILTIIHSAFAIIFLYVGINLTRVCYAFRNNVF